MSEPDRILRRDLLWLALGVTVVRLVAGGAIHLTEDEAYYRLWAQHLQFGYLDHPPMIAWWIRAGQAVFGDTALGLRLLPALSSGAGAWLVGDVARRLGTDARTAFRAALWYNATLTVCLGDMLATPDVPASFFWTLTLWFLALVWREPQTRWWLAAGLAAGLAVLSKYSGLFLAPGVLLWLLLTPEGRAQLRRPGPWAAAVMAGLVFSLNVAWNAQHHWVTFIKQFGRAEAHGLAPGRVAEFLITQFLLLTPLISLYAAKGVAQAWRERTRPGAAHLMLPAATSAPFAAYLLVHSLHDRVQGHWPVPLFGALAICAAAALGRTIDAPAGRIARWLAPGFGLVLGGAALLILALPPVLPGRLDPTAPLRGWPGFAADIERLRTAKGAAWVGTQSYGVLSQLRYAGGLNAPVLQITERERYHMAPAGQPDPDRPDLARPGLVVDLQRRLTAEDLASCFAVVTPAGPLDRAGGAVRNERYAAFLVAQPRRDIWTLGCPGGPAPDR